MIADTAMKSRRAEWEAGKISDVSGVRFRRAVEMFGEFTGIK
jgi:hypothetical protein